MSTLTAEPSADTLLLRSDEGGVATLTLNRPKQFNALSSELLSALQQELDQIKTDKRVRVVVIAGNGRAFCAGHDFKQMRANPDQTYYETLFKQCGQLMLSVHTLPQPVIAKVHGIATAAGCQLVAACDLAVASDEAKFATSGIRYGLFCSTPAVPVSRNVGRKKSMEMLMTGEFLSAEEALTEGLINRVSSPDELEGTVKALCDAIVAKPALAVRLGKEMFYKQLSLPLDQAYDYAADVMACNMIDDTALEGVSAFLEKRAPSWSA